MKIFQDAGFKTRYWAFRPQWYHTCYSDKYAHFVVNYDGSIYKALVTVYPQHNWIPWNFEKVPNGFWEDTNNQKKFI